MPAIALDFKKKERKRPKTDRAGADEPDARSAGKKDVISLLEKKKKYSMAIREKNLGRSRREESEAVKSNTNILIESDTNQAYYGIKGNKEQKGKPETKAKPAENKQSQEYFETFKTVQSPRMKDPRKEERPKCRDSRREKSKAQRLVANETLDAPFQSNISLMSMHQHEKSVEEQMSIDLSMIGRLQEFTKIEENRGPLQLCSREVDDWVAPSGEMKELDQLKRHNATFKKELATFRRENGTVKREAEELRSKYKLIQRNWQ